mmetsp:Transcript_32890/g.79571  ORF Transcript_32890/g.79571 Transcript_32890/m.79571 type:complete len:108 (-) Transcript_32890:58-381(-)
MPPMLLVQDSYYKRPLLEIGLDLLIDMGIDDLQFFAIPRNWSFRKDRDYKVKEGSHAHICGSRMHMDNAGIVHLEKEEQTMTKKPDMSYCLEPVDPNKHHCFFVGYV